MMKICVNFEAELTSVKTGERERFRENIIGIVDFVLEAQRRNDFDELSVTFVDEDEIARLNEEFRGKSSSTDVLSFPCDDKIMGDIVICPQIAAAQSAEYGNTAEEEIYQLLIHGLLHLLGYDHMTDEDYETMRLRESEIWRAFNVK